MVKYYNVFKKKNPKNPRLIANCIDEMGQIVHKIDNNPNYYIYSYDLSLAINLNNRKHRNLNLKIF